MMITHRILLSFSLFFISAIIHAQISLNDLKIVLKLNEDKFETFALNKGYSFYYRSNDGEMNAYRKGEGETAKFLVITYEDGKKLADFQTRDSKDLLLFKNQLKEQGFTFVKISELEENKNIKYYYNTLYKVRIVTIRAETEVVYEIILENK